MTRLHMSAQFGRRRHLPLGEHCVNFFLPTQCLFHLLLFISLVIAFDERGKRIFLIDFLLR